MKKLAVFLLLGTVYHSINAQISGVILDNNTREPVPFVNIGVVSKSMGTVSNENGLFFLNTAAAGKNDTIMISMVGYKRITCSVAGFSTLYPGEKATIYLTPEIFNLNEVTIRPKKIINKTLGNTTDSRGVTAGFTSNELGSEIGIPMHVKKNKRCLIDTLCFNINNCKFDSVLFRVNIYTMKSGKPDSAILTKPLYVVSKIKFGTLRVDVTSLKLSTNGDFFVSLEWLKDLGKRGLDFPAGITNTHAYVRNASQSKWEKVPVGVGFYCKTRIEK